MKNAAKTTDIINPFNLELKSKEDPSQCVKIESTTRDISIALSGYLTALNKWRFSSGSTSIVEAACKLRDWVERKHGHPYHACLDVVKLWKSKGLLRLIKSGQKEIEPSKNPLIGKYFHSIKDGFICWQGIIIGSPEHGLYLIQLFDWLMGQPSVQRLVLIDQMMDWLFYSNANEMTHSYDHGSAKRLKKPESDYSGTVEIRRFNPDKKP